MTRERKKRTPSEPTFVRDFKAMVKQPGGQARINAFVELICELLDDATTEGDVWFNVGLNRSRLCPMITLHEGDVVAFAGGATLSEFLSEAEGL